MLRVIHVLFFKKIKKLTQFSYIKRGYLSQQTLFMKYCVVVEKTVKVLFHVVLYRCKGWFTGYRHYN
jgi:hypothetical protein